MSTRKVHKICMIFALGWALSFALLLLLTGEAQSREMSLGNGISSYNPFQLDELSMTYRDFLPQGRDPLVTQNGLPNRGLGQELILTLNTDVLRFGYFNNSVHTRTDKPVVEGGPAGQFRTVGWQFEGGLRLTSWLQGGYHHHSQHEMDNVLGFGEFPVEDAIEVKIFFFKQGAKRGLLPW